MEAVPFSNPEAARLFIRGGNARLTVRSQNTGHRYTYRVRAMEEDKDQPPARRRFFVSLLKGRDNNADYSYIGMIRGDRFFTTKATKHMTEAAFVRGFRFAYEWLARRHAMPPNAELWHESRCGRCNRPLTVPESIASGFGPECINHVGE